MNDISREHSPPMNLYFAYGSNLDAAQMTARCPSATLAGAGRLDGYRIAFAGRSSLWGGGVATVVRDRGQHVDGLVWAIDAADLARLDRFEGHPFAYRRKRLLVWLDGRRRQVQVYVKPRAAWSLPTRPYLETIVTAYLEHGFDAKPLIQAVAGGAR